MDAYEPLEKMREEEALKPLPTPKPALKESQKRKKFLKKVSQLVRVKKKLL